MHVVYTKRVQFAYRLTIIYPTRLVLSDYSINQMLLKNNGDEKYEHLKFDNYVKIGVSKNKNGDNIIYRWFILGYKKLLPKNKKYLK